MLMCQDLVTVVTGGAHGIGLAYCRALAKAGAQVVIADLDRESAESEAASLREEGQESLGLGVDVAQVSDTERMVRVTLEHFKRIDVLINNAAIFQRPSVSQVPVERLSVEEWDRVLEVNLKGVFLCCRSVIPSMKERRSGRIINIASGTVFKGAARLSHYVASKAGVVGFTRALARELGEYNVNVNCLAPGLTMSLETGDEKFRAHAEDNLQSRCFKRLETPDDLVGSLLFLCSSASDFITGQTLVVDGGSVML